MHGELLKLGIPVSQATVAKYMVRQRKPPSQTWRAFLNNQRHWTSFSADFFVVPTVDFQLLFVFVILDHKPETFRFHFAVTSNPTAEWTARQLLEAFPWGLTPPGTCCATATAFMDSSSVTWRKDGHSRSPDGAPEPLAKTPTRKRLIGFHSARMLGSRHCFHSAGMRRILNGYFDYYERCRTHLSLEKDAPVSRPAEASLARSCDRDSKGQWTASSLHAQSGLIDKDFQAFA